MTISKRIEHKSIWQFSDILNRKCLLQFSGTMNRRCICQFMDILNRKCIWQFPDTLNKRCILIITFFRDFKQMIYIACNFKIFVQLFIQRITHVCDNKFDYGKTLYWFIVFSKIWWQQNRNNDLIFIDGSKSL